jgi:hypothetical protein
MYAPDDPQAMTPDERLQTIAAVLAAGIQRLNSTNGFLPIRETENAGNSFADRLELPGKTRLSVTSGQRHEP